MQGLIVLVVVIVIISAVVGAIAQFLNKVSEASAPPPRRPAGPRRDPNRASDDMDRFLAEIDRLRRKNAECAEAQAEPPAARPQSANRPAAAIPVARPVGSRQNDRGRARPVAEPAQPPPRPRRGVDRSAMAAPPAPVAPGTLSPVIRAEELPVATVVTSHAMTAGALTGAPVAQVTRPPTRGRPAPKTDFARNLTALLASGQGPAVAVVLQEVLGPPKCRRRS